MFERWNIPERILRDTEAAFRKAEHEVFVLWTSRLDLRDGVDVTPDIGQVMIGGFRLRSAPPRG